MRKAYLVVLLVLVAASGVRAQQKLGIDTVLKILADSFPQERVYLHLDKDRYMAGDTLWFKAYFSSGGLPGGSSTGIHVELFNAAGGRVVQKYFPVIARTVALGEMELVDTLTQGLYTLRAYSDWMSNFDPDLFYHYTFPVYSPFAKSRATKDTAPPAIDMQFLPEGGDAVEGVRDIVAFRATDQRGFPLTVHGRVVDDLDTVVAEFKTTHDGMGLFQMTPVRGRAYHAMVQTRLGEARISLPVARPDGVVLNTRTTDGGIGFTLRADTLSRYLEQPLQVVATEYGHLVFKSTSKLTADNSETGGFIPTGKLVTGIVTITLFAADGEPLAERLAFIRPSEIRREAILSLDTLNPTARGYNSWNLLFPDTATAYLSVSVTDADVLPPDPNHRDILTGLLLSGDLKGNIYNPAFYFQDDEDSTRELLDLVMRTHGWRRFDWQALEAGRLPEIKYTDDNYLGFSGRAFTESGRKVVSNTMLTVFLRSSDTSKKVLYTILDSSGNFNVDGLFFFDTARAYFQLNKKDWAGKDVQLRLNPSPFFPVRAGQLRGTVFPGESQDTGFVGNGKREAELQEGVRRLQHARELKEIVITGNKKTVLEEMNDHYTSGMFAGGEAHMFSLVNDQAAISLGNTLNYLQGRVPGLRISRQNGGFQALGGLYDIKYRGGQPAFFIDEMKVSSGEVADLPIEEIAFIKVLVPPFFGADNGGPFGAIAIYTRKGGDVFTDAPGMHRISLVGYAPVRSYYSPQYTTRDSAGAYPDYRTTLLWSPYLFTKGASQTIPLRFYNNDACKHFRIIAEGIGEDGKLLHFERVVDAAGATDANAGRAAGPETAIKNN